MGYQDDFKKVLLSPEPHAILGKKGITEEFVIHISSLIKRYKIIKVKALKNVATKENIKQLAAEISDKTGSYLLDVRGKTFILSKNKINK